MKIHLINKVPEYEIIPPIKTNVVYLIIEIEIFLHFYYFDNLLLFKIFSIF